MKCKRPEAETLLRNVLETVNEGVVVFDPDDRMVVCNARYRELYAPIADKLIPGVTYKDMVRAWGRLGLFNATDGTAKEQVQDRLKRHRCPKGPFELHTTEHSVRVEERVTEDGYIIGTHTDITVWKGMERVLQNYEERLLGSTRKRADRFWTMDADLRFTTLVDYPNSNIIASPNSYIGYTRWEAVGIDPETDDAWRRHREDLLAHRPFEDFRYASEDGFGGVYNMSVSGTPVFDDDGVFAGYHGTTTRIVDCRDTDNGGDAG
ncbi:MAG: hypothetical protein GKS00_20530 [Alphaproteobacteria bacterium]|nr:hypothetical protein [Alphaproteobacteria bacterium]